jgi:hypothetical protein
MVKVHPQPCSQSCPLLVPLLLAKGLAKWLLVHLIIVTTASIAPLDFSLAHRCVSLVVVNFSLHVQRLQGV